MLLNRPRFERELAQEGLDAVVLATEPNIVYGADYGSEFMLGHFEDNCAAVILPRDPKIPAALIVPEFDLPYAAARPSWIEDIRVYGSPWSSVGAFMGATLEAKSNNTLRRDLGALRARAKTTQQPDFLAAVAAALKDRGLAKAKLGCDDPRVAQKLAALGLGPFADVLWTMRRVRLVKTPPERAILTQCARINADALTKVVAAGRPGMPEDDLTRVYRRHLAENDARHVGQRGMMFGTGDASSFSLPASHERALSKGDAIVLDCLGTWQGYFMDLARTGVVGEPTPAQKLRFEAVKSALIEIEARMKAGVHTQDVREWVRDAIVKFGLRRDMVSVTTHALGLEVFEFPYPDSLAKGFMLEDGMIVNTEVFYRDPELGSFHLEDSVAVDARGTTLLHPVPRELVVFA